MAQRSDPRPKHPVKQHRVHLEAGGATLMMMTTKAVKVKETGEPLTGQQAGSDAVLMKVTSGAKARTHPIQGKAGRWNAI